NESPARRASPSARPSGVRAAAACGVISADLYSKKISRSMLGACRRSARRTASSGAVVGASVMAGDGTWLGGEGGAGGTGCGDGRADAGGAGDGAGALAADPGAAGAAAGGGDLRDTPLSLSIRSSTALLSAPDWTLPSVSFSWAGSAPHAGALRAS